jgi:flagellar hook protein FlgE
MSILKSLQTGLSGISANSRAISVVGDNIANMNTVGYKESRANFESMLTGSQLGGGTSGNGAKVSGISESFEQGSLKQTGRRTDMAINGEGFFAVQGNLQGKEGEYYTRAGQFDIDKEGFLTTGGGLKLQGYGTDGDGNIDKSGGIQSLKVGSQATAAETTNEITANLNLDASATNDPGGTTSTDVTDATTSAFEMSDPSGSSNFSSSVTLHDSRGNEIQATVYYTKSNSSNTDANETDWEYNVVVDESKVEKEGGSPDITNGLQKIGRGYVSFDDSGNLTEQAAYGKGSNEGVFDQGPNGTGNADPVADSLSFDPEGAAEGDLNDSNFQNMSIDFTGTTNYNSTSVIRSIDQDGRSAGELQDINVEKDGEIVGTFTNNETKKLGQVAVASFDSKSDLERMGKNFWKSTTDSGPAAMGEAASGGRGGIASGALESSNVDLAHQFTKLTANQRAFQASSKTITTSNQLLQQTINLKR